MDLLRPASMLNPPPFAGPELECARRPLLALARSLGSDPELAEELAQATLATAVERRDSFDESRALRPWLCGILVRLHARTRRRRHLGLDALEGREPIATAASDPVRAAERAELARALAAALASSSATDRAVLAPWLAGEGHPAAAATGLTTAATRVRLHRARGRLREKLRRGLGTLAALVGLGRGRAQAEPAVSTTLFPAVLVGALALAAWPVSLWLGARASVTVPTTALEAGWSPGALTPTGPTLSPPIPEALPDGASEHERTLGVPPTFRELTARTEDARIPPGTVLLAGGETIIGSTPEAIQALIEDTPGAAQNVRALDAETPQHTRALAPFHLGATAVTNEQYEVFVRATGHRPPDNWGGAAIDAARREFLVDAGGANIQRRKNGVPLLDSRFDREVWWSRNWRTAEWAVPDGAALLPVVYVDEVDVRAYCRWAGVRLPTEFEFQHAVRGTTDRSYPWGADWQDGRYCATSEDRENNRVRPVGTFREGCSTEGVWELAGNVWEWTSSPYVAYPRFEKNTYRIDGGREKMPEPTWDGNMRVVVGGSYQTSRLVARCTVRRPTDRDERTHALGFRIAASTRAARDLAAFAAPEWIDLLPDLELDATVGVDRWSARPRRPEDPEGYAVITDYRYLAFVPSRTPRPGLEGEGLFLTSEPLAEPPLAPGAYAVSVEAGALVFRTRGGEVAATCPAPPGPRAGAPAVEFWTQVAADGAEREGLSLTTDGLRVDLLPRTPLHDWRR